MSVGNVYFAKHEGLLVLKFVGEIRYTMGESYRISASLDSFLEQMFEDKGFDNVLIDLSETRNIDSTNLGLLARLAQFTQKHFDRKPTIISTNEDINSILDSVGFSQVFIIVHNPETLGVELEAVPSVSSQDRELARMLLEAHKALTDISEKNRDMFRNVVQILEKRVSDLE